MTYTSLGVPIFDGQKKSAKVFRQFRLSCRELQTATPYVPVVTLDVAKKLVCTLNPCSSRYISAWFVLKKVWKIHGFPQNKFDRLSLS